MHSTTVHYMCGGLHEICSTARSFDLRCESVTFHKYGILFFCCLASPQKYLNTNHFSVWLEVYWEVHLLDYYFSRVTSLLLFDVSADKTSEF